MYTLDGLNINTNILNKPSEQPHDHHQINKELVHKVIEKITSFEE